MILTFITVILYIIFAKYSKKITLPVFIVSLWWLILLCVSTYSFTSLYPPGLKTQLLCILMVVGINLGALVKIKSPAYSFLKAQRCEDVLKKVFIISVCCQFLISFYFFFRSLKMILASGGLQYKLEAFSTITSVGKLFESRMIENLYFLISSPLLLFLTLYGIVAYYKSNKLTPFIIAILLNCMDGTMRLARVNIYCSIVLFFFVFTILKLKDLNSFKKVIKPLLISFFLGCLILFIGVVRNHSLQRQVELFVVDYHTVGFTLFDQELTNPHSPLNTKSTYGRLFFGGLETIATIAIRQNDKSYMTPALENSIRMGENRVTGIEKIPSETFHGIKRYNSFYTMLYTFYSDAKIIGIFLGGFILGLVLNYHYQKWLSHQEALSLMWVILLANTILFSIFISQPEIMRTWMLIMGLVAVDIYGRIYLRSQFSQINR